MQGRLSCGIFELLNAETTSSSELLDLLFSCGNRKIVLAPLAG